MTEINTSTHTEIVEITELILSHINFFCFNTVERYHCLHTIMINDVYESNQA